MVHIHVSEIHAIEPSVRTVTLPSFVLQERCSPVTLSARGLPALTALLLEPSLQLSLLRVVHDIHDVEIVDDVIVGDTISVRAQLDDVQASGGGAVVHATIETSTARGLALRTTARVTARPSRAERDEAKPCDKHVEAVWTATEHITASRVAAACAELNDNNPAFVDVEVARLAGMPRPMAPWLFALSLAAQHAPPPWTKLRARWRGVLLHDDVLTIVGDAAGNIAANAFDRRILEVSFT